MPISTDLRTNLANAAFAGFTEVYNTPEEVLPAVTMKRGKAGQLVKVSDYDMPETRESIIHGHATNDSDEARKPKPIQYIVDKEFETSKVFKSDDTPLLDSGPGSMESFNHELKQMLLAHKSKISQWYVKEVVIGNTCVSVHNTANPFVSTVNSVKVYDHRTLEDINQKLNELGATDGGMAMPRQYVASPVAGTSIRKDKDLRAQYSYGDDKLIKFGELGRVSGFTIRNMYGDATKFSTTGQTGNLALSSADEKNKKGNTTITLTAATTAAIGKGALIKAGSDYYPVKENVEDGATTIKINAPGLVKDTTGNVTIVKSYTANFAWSPNSAWATIVPSKASTIKKGGDLVLDLDLPLSRIPGLAGAPGSINLAVWEDRRSATVSLANYGGGLLDSRFAVSHTW